MSFVGSIARGARRALKIVARAGAVARALFGIKRDSPLGKGIAAAEKGEAVVEAGEEAAAEKKP